MAGFHHHLHHPHSDYGNCGQSSLAKWSLFLLVLMMSSRLTSADDYDGDDDFNYYDDDDDDDDDEFEYGDVYTFDEQEAPVAKKVKQEPIHFRSNKVNADILDQPVDAGLVLQADHKQYAQDGGHPGAGVHNGHEGMDKTHVNLVHDIKDTVRYDGVVGDVIQGQTKVRMDKVPYRPAYDVGPAAQGTDAEKPARFDAFDSDPFLMKSKPHKVPFGRGGLSRESQGISQFGPYQKVKPPFLKAVPIKEDDEIGDHEFNPEYFEPEERGDGYHFTSSKRNTQF